MQKFYSELEIKENSFKIYNVKISVFPPTPFKMGSWKGIGHVDVRENPLPIGKMFDTEVGEIIITSFNPSSETGYISMVQFDGTGDFKDV